MGEVEIGILGPLRVMVAGREIGIGAPKRRALLSRLAIASGRPVPIDRLADDLWDGAPPPGVASVLHSHISRLRREFAGEGGDGTAGRNAAQVRLLTEPGGYVLAAAPGVVDAVRFEREAASALELRPSEVLAARDRLASALSRWRGPALVEVAEWGWAAPEAARLEELRLVAIEAKVRADLTLGRAAEVVAELEALVAENPLREGLWCRLMTALYRTGRQAEALRAYARLRQHLGDELGLEPGSEARNLEGAILRQDPALERREPVAPGRAVVDRRPLPAPAPGERGRSTTIVGRDRERGVLAGVLDRAGEGTGQVAVLAGDAGIGKTRLATDLAEAARRAGWEVLHGGCSDEEVTLPFLPFVEAVANRLGSAAAVEQVRAVVGPLARDLGRLFPVLVPDGQVADVADPNQARLRLFEGIVQLLGSLAPSGRGLLLVLEDLHWADGSTCELVAYLSHRTRSLPLVVLLTLRPDELRRGAALAGSLRAWRRDPDVEVVDLAPLGLGGVTELAAQMLGAATPSDGSTPIVTESLGALLLHHSDGNPFALEELVHQGLAGGDLVARDDRWVSLVPDGMRLPRSVTETVLRRIDRLGAPTIEVLHAASVLGRSFRWASLAALAGAGPGTGLEVDAALKDGVDGQLLVPEPGDDERYRFRHALTHQAIYADLAPSTRRRLHRLAAAQCEAEGATAAETARHHIAGGCPEAAAPFCLVAGRDALAVRSYAEAVALLVRAVDGIGEHPDRAEALRCLGEALAAAGDLDAAAARLEEAVDLAFASRSDGGDAATVVAARARLSLGQIRWMQAEPAAATAAYEAALADLEVLGPSADLATALTRLSSVAAFAHDPERAFTLAERAVAIASEVRADGPRLLATGYLGVSLFVLGRRDEGIAWMDRAWAEALDLGVDEAARPALYNAAAGRILALRAAEVPDLADRIAFMASSSSRDFMAGYLRGEAALFLGDVVSAVAAYGAAARMAQSGGSAIYRAWAEESWAHALAEAGRVADARPLLGRSHAGIERQDLAGWALARLRVALVGCDRSAANEVCDAALDGIEVVAQADPVLSVLVEALVWLGRHEDARVAVAAATATPGAWERLSLARLAIIGMDAESANDHASAAVAAFGAAGYRLDEARARLVLARSLELQGDAVAGHREACAAEAVAVACAAPPLAGEAASLAALLRGRGR